MITGGVRCLCLGAVLVVLTATDARAILWWDEEAPRPSLVWFATQLVPSPEIALGEGRPEWGLRWQLTPLLYSWGVDRRVSRWRSFVVDPFARHVGSVEGFASPELLLGGRSALFWRLGARAYWPVLEHGEALSVSLGASHQRVDAVDAVAIELGAYILFGVLGIQASYAPDAAGRAQTTLTLSRRYF